MSVTAKVVLSRTEPHGPEQTTLYFGADYADGANAEWAAATPALSLTMTVRRDVADTHFPEGAKFTLRFDQEDTVGDTDATEEAGAPASALSADDTDDEE